DLVGRRVARLSVVNRARPDKRTVRVTAGSRPTRAKTMRQRVFAIVVPQGVAGDVPHVDRAAEIGCGSARPGPWTDFRSVDRFTISAGQIGCRAVRQR